MPGHRTCLSLLTHPVSINTYTQRPILTPPPPSVPSNSIVSWLLTFLEPRLSSPPLKSVPRKKKKKRNVQSTHSHTPQPRTPARLQSLGGALAVGQARSPHRFGQGRGALESKAMTDPDGVLGVPRWSRRAIPIWSSRSPHFQTRPASTTTPPVGLGQAASPSPDQANHAVKPPPLAATMPLSSEC